MNDFDVVAPNYRRAQRRWPTAPLLRTHYEALTSCWTGNGHGLVEYIKSFVECVCRTILAERGVPDDPRATNTRLLIMALDALGLRNSQRAYAIDKILSAFNKMSDALADVRNKQGPVAHGKSGFIDSLSADHRRVFLYVGDAILGLVLARDEDVDPDLLTTHQPYEYFGHLHALIDDAVSAEVDVDDGDDPVVLVVSLHVGDEVMVFRIEPSRFLYEIDRDAYVEALGSAGNLRAHGAD